MTRCAECIVQDVARAFEVSPAELRLPDRHQRITRARFAAYRMMREERGLSYTQIGRMLGHRDHSTVMLGIRQAVRLLASDAEFAARYEEARG